MSLITMIIMSWMDAVCVCCCGCGSLSLYYICNINL